MQYRRGTVLFLEVIPIKFQGYKGKKVHNLIPILSDISRPVAAIKSLRFALLIMILDENICICKYWYKLASQSWYIKIKNYDYRTEHKYC